MTKLANAFFEFKEGDFKPRVVFFQHPGEEIVPAGMLPSGIAPEDGLFDAEKAMRFLVERVRELEAENRTLGERLCETEHDLTEALDKKEELERRAAELAHENSNQKRVIQMLEYRVLDLKGQPIPMEPRLPTCDALVHPRHPLQSNRSNSKEP